MLTEMGETLGGVKDATDYPMFTRLVLDLGEKALARHEVLKGAYYLRLAEFFVLTEDARKLPTRQRFVDLILDHFQIPSSAYNRLSFESGWFPAYRLTPAQPESTLVVFGGFDVTSRNGCPQRCSSATPATTRSYSKAPARGHRSNWRTCP
jgi:hypothetical protein